MDSGCMRSSCVRSAHSLDLRGFRYQPSRRISHRASKSAGGCPRNIGDGVLPRKRAYAVVRHAFESLALDALVSFTVPANIRSLRVMEKIGMTRNPADDFDHPNLPEGHPLRRHVLYRLPAPSRKPT